MFFFPINLSNKSVIIHASSLAACKKENRRKYVTKSQNAFSFSRRDHPATQAKSK